MFTPEIINLLGGTLIGGILKLWSKSADERARLIELAIQKAQQNDASADKAAVRGGPIARRMIVICVLFTVFLAPFILSAWFPEVPIFYAYSEAKAGGFWFFRSSIEQLTFVRLDGFVLLPIHTQMASAIAGFYFGAGIVK